MPNFKPKANKKIKVNKKSTITLDSKHNEKMQEFDDIQNKIIPELVNKKKLLRKKLKITTNIEDKLNIQDEIRDIKTEISRLKQQKQEYLLENSNIIFEYFEKKKKMSDGIDINKKKILHSFFNPNKKVKKKVVDETNINKYLINMDEGHLNINNYVINYEICEKCGGEWIQVDHKGLVICNKCGIQKQFLVEHEKPSYKEPPKEVCFYAYKRINHFREILAQFQAKETTQIPDEVLENIRNQIKKERITLKQMTNKKAKDILKKLGYNKYYEHIPFIKDKLGIRPPIMSPELEEKLCNLFMEIQMPYAKHCPDDRVNFLNYYYVLYKMCELLDEKTFLPFFPMLKDPVKRIEQDEIWKKICKELHWEFVPTI
jgi:predicted  nucleic acid-binding Zn-ribbon protein